MYFTESQSGLYFSKLPLEGSKNLVTVYEIKYADSVFLNMENPFELYDIY